MFMASCSCEPSADALCSSLSTECHCPAPVSNPVLFASPEALGCCTFPGVSNTCFPCQPHKPIWQRCFHTAPQAIWKGTKQFWGSVVGLGGYCVWPFAFLVFRVQDCSGNSVPHSKMWKDLLFLTSYTLTRSRSVWDSLVTPTLARAQWSIPCGPRRSAAWPPLQGRQR